ncbi:ZZ-type zinc finger-containing protein 3-like isoform X2 [Varroa jacobsoni]|uniref:ZZ-type zinc finger-containing protein 3 n=1 Tax=Varroa destructor TaxID=109461 RepID=A0A7M7IXK5_VARDE|nr:ZZ-type zinc finger-containing protein 3-like isoform X2 [Varroa destructor]XP_022687122.1 ZZ-type zinc finger-containing protein 3-like isoform X2 [Varroa jacobsoni]
MLESTTKHSGPRCWALQMEEDVSYSIASANEDRLAIKQECASPQRDDMTLFVEDSLICETVVTSRDDALLDVPLSENNVLEKIDTRRTEFVGSYRGPEDRKPILDSNTSSEVGSNETSLNSQPTSTSVLEVERQTFSFETDHLALRANNEYKSIVKLLVLLEAQRMRAIQDINQLEAEKKVALENPMGFVQRLQERTISLPTRQIVAEVPEVDCARYAIPPVYLGATPKSTRAAAGAPDQNATASTSSAQGPSSSSLLHELSSTYSEKEPSPSARQLQQHSLKNRPETYNKPWSIEEQKRLEELLIKFPPEAVEAQRWRKIAAALGNRTIKQVASRVQKYFIKLAKAGLEVPGRVPNIPKSSRKVRRVQSTLKTQAFYLSTFFPQHASPITMDPDTPLQESPVVLSNHNQSKDNKSSQAEIHCGVCLKKLDSSLRFQCVECNVNLCVDGTCRQKSSCVIAGHVVQMVADTQVDSDYVINDHYLDPNYLPSTS